MNLILIILIVISCVFIYLIISKSLKIFKLTNKGIRTLGTIVNIKEYTDHDGQKNYYPIIEFTDENGKICSYVIERGKFRANSIIKGDKIKIIYQNKNDLLVVEDSPSKWTLIVIYLFFLLVLTILIFHNI